ncbi:MAG: hypothetical protein N2C12_15610, partial [Planctomycetales bacterium]
MNSVRHLISICLAGIFLLAHFACSDPINTDPSAGLSGVKEPEDQPDIQHHPVRSPALLNSDWSATAAIEALQSIGGKLVQDEKDPKRPVKEIDLAFLQSRLTDDQLAAVAGFTDTRHLSLERTVVSDAGMKHLRLLKNLESLNLNLTRVTGKGLANIEGVSKLRLLELSGPRITDHSLKHLPRLPSLEELRLRNTSVTDRGLKSIAQFSGLNRLDLEGTQVTGSGLDDLSHLDLESLNLGHSQITMAGLESIRKLS